MGLRLLIIAALAFGALAQRYRGQGFGNLLNRINGPNWPFGPLNNPFTRGSWRINNFGPIDPVEPGLPDIDDNHELHWIDDDESGISVNGRVNQRSSMSTFSSSFTSSTDADGFCDDCPPAVCVAGCRGMSRSPADDCPICLCGESLVREPCRRKRDCEKDGACRKGACHYQVDDLPGTDDKATEAKPFRGKGKNRRRSNRRAKKECEFRFQCPAGQVCSQGKCERTRSAPRHIPRERCKLTHDCPAEYDCLGHTCIKDGRRHVEGVRCVFSHECPSGFLCERDDLTCFSGGPVHPSRSCEFSEDCPRGFSCRDSSCLP